MHMPNVRLVLAGLLIGGLWFALSLAVARAATVAQTSCDIVWTYDGGGDWNTASNWNPQRVPAADDRVCIQMAGYYVVQLSTDTTVASLNLDAPAGTRPTLVIASGTFTVTGMIDNSEKIQAASSAYSPRIIAGSIINRGLLEINGSYETQLAANVVNETSGIIAVKRPLTFNRPGGVVTNRGSIKVDPNITVTITGPDKTFVQEGGELLIDGDFGVDQGGFEFNGGTVTANPPSIHNGRLVIAPGSTATGTLKLTGDTSLTGDVRAGQTLLVGRAGYADTFTVEGSTTNAGTIRINGWRLVVNNGVLTNGVGGKIDILAGTYLLGNLDNRGTLAVQSTLSLDRSNAVYTNSGAINIGQGQSLTINGTNPSFTQTGGALNNNGAFTLNNGVFTFNGGSMSGVEPLLNESRLVIGPSSGPARIAVSGGSSTISGDVRAGQTLLVRDGTLTASGNFSNFGTILAQQGYGVDIVVNGGVFTNASGATFEAAGSTRILSPFVNQGTVKVSLPLTFDAPNATFINAGSITIESGQTITVNRGTFVNQGTVSGLAGNFTINGEATLPGTGIVAANVANYGTISPGGAAYGRLQIGGTLNQQGALVMQIGGGTPGADLDQLAVGGEVTLGGTLRFSFADGFLPDAGSEFPILTFASVAGGTNFGTVSGQASGLLNFETAPGATSYLVRVTQVLGTAGPPWLVLLYLAGDDVAPSAERMTGLSAPMVELLSRLGRMPYNPDMRLVVLYDGDQSGDSRIYVRQPTVLQDVTEQAAASPLWLGGMGGAAGARELNTGSVATLQNFLGWARATYPGSKHTMLSIVDHGGGWAPDLDQPGQPRGFKRVQAGGWRGMSLDMSSDGSSLATRNIGQALQGQRIDVLFFDACLMGMIETAYEVRDLADFLVASENLLFAQLPYEVYLAKDGLTAATQPLDLAKRLVDSYNGAASSAQNPFTIAALDLRQLRSDVAGSLPVQVNGLASALLAALPEPAPADDPLVQALTAVYSQTQKFDYDSSLTLDDREGYVDLVDFARRLRDSPSQAVPAPVRAAAGAVAAAAVEGAAPVVVRLRTVSGVFDDQPWSFAGANGLSIFLPLGERDYRPTQASAGDPSKPAQAERQLTYYADAAQLAFTGGAPQWAALLLRLEGATPIIRTGPGGLPTAGLAAGEIIDTRAFNAPYPVQASQAIFLPIVRR